MRSIMPNIAFCAIYIAIYIAAQAWDHGSCHEGDDLHARSSVAPYNVSRSSTSRSLKFTRPVSSRLIFECEARMT